MKNLLQLLSTLTLCMTIAFGAMGQSCDCNTSIVGSAIFGTGAGANNPTTGELTALGYGAGAYSTGYRNTFVGTSASYTTTSGSYNTAFGAYALRQNQTGDKNTALGYHAGTQLKGSHNIAIGSEVLSNVIGANHFNLSSNVVAIGYGIGMLPSAGGSELVIIGTEAGGHYAGGDRSTIIGHSAGRAIGGNDVVAIGANAGSTNIGDGCIFIGSGMDTGVWGTPSNYANHLFIGNGTNKEFLVGDMAAGKLGINTNAPQNALDVCGKIRSDEVIIENNWCDFVFDVCYDLPSLEEEAQHIEEEGHLIGFQSEEEMNGEIHLSDVTKRQQVKIEEVILHLIEMNKRLDVLEAENTELKEEVKQLRSK